MKSLYIALNMIQRVIGNVRGFLLMVMVPVIVLSVFVGLFKQGDSSPKIVVAYSSLDRGELDAQYIEPFQKDPSFQIIEKDTLEDVKEAILQGDVDVGLSIPANFTQNLVSGDHVKPEVFFLHQNTVTVTAQLVFNQKLQLLIRSIDMVKMQTNNEQLILSKVSQLLQQQSENRISANVTDFKNATDEKSDGMNVIIGFMLMFLIGMVTKSVAIIVEDRENLTMSRIYTAPVRKFEISSGYFLGSLCLGIIQIIIVLVFTKYILQYNYGISFFPLFLILTFFLIAAMGLSMAVAALVNKPENVGHINSLIVTPTCMIGGCFWPIEIMPDFMQKMANFVPQKWAIEAVSDMSRGETLQQIGLPLGILTLFAAVLLTFGTVILKPSHTKS